MRSPTIGWFSRGLAPQTRIVRASSTSSNELVAAPVPSMIFMPAAVGALPTSDRRERLMVGLAHLANHGCAQELKSLENDPDSSVAMASRQALARCARMEAEDVAVRTQQPLRDNSPEARFSQVFFATLAAAG